MAKLRPNQEAILTYTHGRMGVAAVPGSGKTFTLSLLAAELIGKGLVSDEQEVLIVTMVNSAVRNFDRRIGQFLEETGLIAELGYRVRTLHGLAHDIVRERPDLAGLSDSFVIADEKETAEVLNSVCGNWHRAHPEFQQEFINETSDPSAWGFEKRWMEFLVNLAGNFIRQAKDLQFSPDEIKELISHLHGEYPLLVMGQEIYAEYQRSLNYRSAVDYDDLIRLALRALKADPDFLARLRSRWPYILEDEAQDSSRLQEEILRLLCGEEGNWVRVGDPNQAIYETFTTASPDHLRSFLQEPGVQSRELSNSGRSSLSIISLANFLIDWTRERHPNPRLRGALTLPYIEPAPPGDPQPNPPDNPAEIHLIATPYTPDREIQAVVISLRKWLPAHSEDTVAVLVPRNTRGSEVAASLRAEGIEVVELLRSSASTRQAAGALASVLRALAEPNQSKFLIETFSVWYLCQNADQADPAEKDRCVRLLKLCSRLEDFFTPQPGQDWLDSPAVAAAGEPTRQIFESFRSLMRRWQAASLLPVGELVLTLAQDLYSNPIELALAHKLALALERTANDHPDWHLPEYAQELSDIAENRRKFQGFDQDENDFDPQAHKGKVVVATIHKAKGLEWDRVYLMSVNNYDFPSGDENDTYISEKQFIADAANLEAVALHQLKALAAGDIAALKLAITDATGDARVEYGSERLRLLYVGITRACRELVITWNTGRNGDKVPAQPYIALMTFWSEHHASRP